MKLDRRHVAVALTLLAGSVVYNVWAFGNPRPRPAMESPPPLLAIAGGASAPVPSTEAPATVDLSNTPRAEEVALDRNPVWARNPFTASGAAPREPVAPASAPPGEPEPEIVVNSILYSPTRKLAMVNGRTVRVGDTVGAARVLDIQPHAIVVESPSRGVRTIERRTAGTTLRP